MVDVRTGCPDAQLEPPEDNSPIVGECCMCGYEIPVGEEFYDIEGEAVCDECGRDYLNRHRKVVSWNDI